MSRITEAPQNSSSKSPFTAWWQETRVFRGLRITGSGPRPAPKGLSFYAPDFALLEPNPWLWGEKCEPETLFQNAREPLPRLAHRAEPSSADFARVHEEIMKRIAAGEFKKVVPIICEEWDFEAPLHHAMFEPALGQVYPHQFNYGFEFDGQGLCGVTPEILFSVQGSRLTTMALAGTGRVDGPSLLEDQKETHEHNLVIEYLIAELKNLGEVEIGATVEQPYGALKHLLTPISVRLQRKPSFAELVAKLHPTPALGGWPREPAVRWLEDQKFHFARRRFGAPFGFQDDEEMRCLVAIRSVQWFGHKALISAGCGVVKGSESLREWRELELKRQAIYKLVGVTP